MALATCGPMMPGRLFARFVRPLITPAYLGAMSNTLAEVPAMDSPNTALESVRKVTAVAVDVPK